MPAFIFDNSYARLPAGFYRPCEPTPVAKPRLIRLNRELAQELGLQLDRLDSTELANVFAGNRLPDGAEPLAMAYAGHQFGNLVPQLGDGRAVLLGEVIDRQGRRRDIQLKGSGATPFSRGGDGRAPLGPVIREYLVSEAMHALGVPTTRALAAVTTGERVYREDALPGAVLTRVATSHVRIGTFEFFAIRDQQDKVRTLADYVIQRHYPELAAESHPYLALLQAMADKQAELVAQWMGIGFIHGVMNTDNMTVSGETIDYGPCAFMDHYHPDTVFSSIDTGGRYAYRMQPLIAQWNVARFAECLVPLIDEDRDRAIEVATEVVRDFMPRYEQTWLARMRAKLGLYTEQAEDQALIDDLFGAMADNTVDFTLLFRSLCTAAAKPTEAAEPRELLDDPRAWDNWAARWAARLQRESLSAEQRAERMEATNPAIIPRNHRIEQAISKATDEGDFGDFERLCELFGRPYQDDPLQRDWLGPPAPEERVRRTFCGT